MDKFEAIDMFKDRVMDEFISLCNYNDFDKINLLTIGDTVDRIYDECIEEIQKGEENE